jgi:hypothetical protein
MAAITLLHWNIETYGPTKFVNGNNAAFISYIANLVNNVDADIFSMVEVKNSISANVPGLIAADVNALQGIAPAANPWRSVRMNSLFNNEAYIVMFRTDRNFQPAQITINGVVNGPLVNPDHGSGMHDVNGNRIQFPSRWTAQCGRRPFYVTFQTTDTNRTFSVISYHAMFGNATPWGVHRLPSLDYIRQFEDGPPSTPIDESLIAGDFNEDFFPTNNFYQNMLGLPSVQATNSNTSLLNNPPGGDDPDAYLANAYDNIFQTVAAAAPAGDVVDLMVESSVVIGPQPPPPAAQPRVGNLSAAAGAFNVANIPNHWALNPVAAVPVPDMPQAWGFVREAISNHYPVFSTVNI